MYEEVDFAFRVFGFSAEEGLKNCTGRKAIFNLGKGPFWVGIDQATSNSGIAVLDKAKNLVAMFDLHDDGLPSKEIYPMLFKKFLYNQFKDSEIIDFVLEIPIMEKGTKRVYGKLKAIKSKLEELPFEYDEFKDSKVQSILPGTWRKHFLKDKRYAGQKGTKVAAKLSAMKETCLRFPEFEPYVQYIAGMNVSDSSDAVGIICGFLDEYYWKYPIRRVSVLMEGENSLNYTADIQPFSVDNLLEELKGKYGKLIAERGYELLAFNETLSLADNCRRTASNTNKISIIMALNAKSVELLKWSSSRPGKQGEVYCVVVFRWTPSKRLPVIPAKETEFWRS